MYISDLENLKQEYIFLKNSNKINKALDLLFDYIDNISIYQCNQIFDNINIENMGIQFVIGLLTITLPYKNKLSNRKKFFYKVYYWLKEIEPIRYKKIIIGLE